MKRFSVLVLLAVFILASAGTARAVDIKAKGTNHQDNWLLLTTKDSCWEVDFNTTWQMYESLAMILELAYGKVNLDDMGLGRGDWAKDALYRGVLGMVYWS